MSDCLTRGVSVSSVAFMKSIGRWKAVSLINDAEL